MFRVGGPLWAQATAGDNGFARIVKSGKKILRKLLQQKDGTAKGTELPKPTWSLSAQPVQLRSTVEKKLVGGLFPKQLWSTQAAELRRRTALRLIANTRKVPVFAFVGLSLGASQAQGSGCHADDAFCSGIRGIFQQYQAKTTEVESCDGQQFSLQTLELGQLIGQGCNAVIYEARPSFPQLLSSKSEREETSELEETPEPKIESPESEAILCETERIPTPAVAELAFPDAASSLDADEEASAIPVPTQSNSPAAACETTSDPVSHAVDLEDDFDIIEEETPDDLSNNVDDANGWVFYRLSPIRSSTPDPANPPLDVDESDIFILATDEGSLEPILGTEEPWEDEDDDIVILSREGGREQMSECSAPGEKFGSDTERYVLQTGAQVSPTAGVMVVPESQGTVPGAESVSSPKSSNSHTEEEEMSTGNDSAEDVEPAPNINSSGLSTDSPADSNSDTDRDKDRGRDSDAVGSDSFPLAVKMMYNYYVESHADRILTAMARETVPAQSRSSQQSLGQNSNEAAKRRLPPHPNIVAMLGVFVDETPRLPGDTKIYPSALPARLHQDGAGRNATMFLVMKKYSMTLREYLAGRAVSMETRCHLLAQLLEGVVHLARHGIAHRDLKTDNILVDLSSGPDAPPLLVICDFGCCLADSTHGLQVPYATGEVDKGGNCALMAPEIKSALPGPGVVLDYTSADLWAAGALAYEIFGAENPFYGRFDARDYSEEELPPLPDEVPESVQRLVQLLLQRDPKKRPTPSVAASTLQLLLWAPANLRPLRPLPSMTPGENANAARLWQFHRISDWLQRLAVETVCQRVFCKEAEATVEILLKRLFLSCLSRHDVLAAISLV